MTFVQTLTAVILALYIYILLYTLVDRICQCREKCAYFRAYAEFMKGSDLLPKTLGENNAKDGKYKRGANDNALS